MGVGMAMLQDKEIQRQISNPNQNSALQENGISTDRISAIVKSCTKKYPYLTVENIDTYVSSDCLIDNAKTVQDCQTFKDVKLMEFEVTDVAGNTRKEVKYFDGVDSCVTKLALQSHEVNTCNSLNNNTECVINYAKQFKEPQSCQNANNSQYCFQTLSQTIGFSVCNLISDEEERSNCGKNYITSMWEFQNANLDKNQKRCLNGFGFTENTMVCILDKLNLEGISKKDLLTWKTDNTLTACLTLRSAFGTDEKQRNDYCLSSIGVYLKDLSICDQAGSARAECYGVIGLTENIVNLDTCDKLDKLVSFCYASVAYRLNDKSICDKPLDDLDFKMNCMIFVNKRNEQM